MKSEVWKRFSLEICVMVLLVLSAWLLGEMVAPGRHPYSLYQVGRLVVFAGWGLAAYTFFRLSVLPASVASGIVALTFNPLLPLRMNRYQWAPYDRAGVWLAIGAALLMGWLVYRHMKAAEKS